MRSSLRPIRTSNRVCLEISSKYPCSLHYLASDVPRRSQPRANTEQESLMQCPQHHPTCARNEPSLAFTAQKCETLKLVFTVSLCQPVFQRLTNELPRVFPRPFGHTPVVFHLARFHQKPPKTRTAPTHARHRSWHDSPRPCVTLCHLGFCSAYARSARECLHPGPLGTSTPGPLVFSPIVTCDSAHSRVNHQPKQNAFTSSQMHRPRSSPEWGAGL